jgi:hypothetical protein
MSNSRQQAYQSNQRSQGYRTERGPGVNQAAAYEMAPPYARVHEIGLAIVELRDAWRRNDPYLAATATSGQVQPSAEVQAHAATQGAPAIHEQWVDQINPVSSDVQFEQLAQQVDPAPQDFVPPTQPPAVPMQQFERV